MTKIIKSNKKAQLNKALCPAKLRLHNDLTDNRRLYQFAYFPIMFGKAGLEPANSGSQSKEISTGSNMVRNTGFEPVPS